MTSHESQIWLAKLVLCAQRQTEVLWYSPPFLLEENRVLNGVSTQTWTPLQTWNNCVNEAFEVFSCTWSFFSLKVCHIIKVFSPFASTEEYGAS